MQLGGVDSGQFGQSRSTSLKFPARAVKKPNSQRTSHTCTAVVCRAAAKADNNARKAFFQGLFYDLAGASGGRDAGISQSGRNQCQAGSLGHFYYGRLPVSGSAPRSLKGLIEWARNNASMDLAASGIDQRV